MAAATDQQEFRFNKFGSVGKAAGFLVVSSGFVIRSVIRDYEGDFSFSNLISQISVPGAVLYTALLIGLTAAVVRAVRKPENRLTVSADDVVFQGRGQPKRIDLASILAVAVLEQPSKIPSIRRRPPNRTVVALSASGTNLEPVPRDGRWVSQKSSERRDIAEQVLAESQLLSELPNDEFGNSMRRRLTGSAAQQIKAMKADHPDLRALIIPLQGMPSDTEEKLKDALPNWI